MKQVNTYDETKSCHCFMQAEEKAERPSFKEEGQKKTTKSKTLCEKAQVKTNHL